MGLNSSRPRAVPSDSLFKSIIPKAAMFKLLYSYNYQLIGWICCGNPYYIGLRY